MTHIAFPSITVDNFDTLTFDSEIPVLAFFGAERCHVCKELLPTVEEIAEELTGKMNFYWVDVDEYKSLFKRFKLKGIPQILIFDEGEIKGRIGGLAEKEDIQEEIKTVIPE